MGTSAAIAGLKFDDKDDKRAKRVRISKKGKNELEKIAPEMQNVYSNMSAGMNINEKLHVITFLKRINDFHKKKEINN